MHSDSLIPNILDKLLHRINHPNLEEHVERLGSKQWAITAARMHNKKKLFSQAFTSVAQLSETYESDKDHWHYAAIVGHTQTSKHFPLNSAEVALLKEWNIVVVAQLFDIDELTGKLEREENIHLKQRL
jgi:hypothetical protein